MSVNGGSKWTAQGDGLPSDEGRFLGQAVVDSKDVIYVTMGQYNGGPLQDIWMSANLGVKWSLVKTTGALPPARAVHGSVVGKYRDGTDAMYIMYGWERGSMQTGIGNVYRNGQHEDECSAVDPRPCALPRPHLSSLLLWWCRRVGVDDRW